ncbi:unnamed protein product [Vicia faba]|uniref:Uncharacterized protein n=1 Tax=Vicia faba TaxID=3906 RepID=A0AAV1BAH8_VICFA|nr:unnamed protein product [Vicia faba]
MGDFSIHDFAVLVLVYSGEMGDCSVHDFAVLVLVYSGEMGALCTRFCCIGTNYQLLQAFLEICYGTCDKKTFTYFAFIPWIRSVIVLQVKVLLFIRMKLKLCHFKWVHNLANWMKICFTESSSFTGVCCFLRRVTKQNLAPTRREILRDEKLPDKSPLVISSSINEIEELVSDECEDLAEDKCDMISYSISKNIGFPMVKA